MSGAATGGDVQALVTIGYLQASDAGNPKRVSRAILGPHQGISPRSIVVSRAWISRGGLGIGARGA